MKTYVDFGTCSACAGPAKRDEDGAWWHVGPTCWAPNVWRPDVTFTPNSANPGKDDDAAQQRAAAEREKAAADAERQQASAPHDRQARPGRNR